MQVLWSMLELCMNDVDIFRLENQQLLWSITMVLPKENLGLELFPHLELKKRLLFKKLMMVGVSIYIK